MTTRKIVPMGLVQQDIGNFINQAQFRADTGKVKTGNNYCRSAYRNKPTPEAASSEPGVPNGSRIKVS